MSSKLDWVREAMDRFDFGAARDLLRAELQEDPSSEAYRLAASVAESDVQRDYFLAKSREHASGDSRVRDARIQGEPVVSISTTQGVGTPVRREALPPQPNASVKAIPRRSGWRWASTALILLTFFAPWFRSCNADITGWGVLSEFTQASFSPSAWNDPGLQLYYLFVILGLTGLLTYCALSALTALGLNPQTNGRAWGRAVHSALIVGAVALASGPVRLGFDLDDFRWGYWLALFGVCMAGGVEWWPAQPTTKQDP